MNRYTTNSLVENKILKITDDRKEAVTDVNIHEAQVLFRINGNYYSTFYCIPNHLEDMARGHIISEGLCQLSDIKKVKVTSKGQVTSVEATISIFNTTPSVVTSTKKITAASIWSALDKLNQNSILFKDTGGAHIIGIFSKYLSVFTEDVSRHCAIDKAIGLALQKKLDITDTMLLTSCRQTASTINKAIYTGIPIVISTSAVSSLAIESAEKYGITLIGFARQRRFNVYSHRERITEND